MKSLQLSKPHFLIMVGGPKSGKSSFAKQFADTFNAPYIDVKSLQFSPTSPTDTLKAVYTVIDQVFKTGQTVIYEGISGSRAERLEIAKLARSHGYEPLLIWVQTDPATAKSRALKKNQQTAEEFDQVQSRFTAPSPTESHVVISGKHTYPTQAKTVLKRLSAAKERPQNTQEREERSSAKRLAARSIHIQ